MGAKKRENKGGQGADAVYLQRKAKRPICKGKIEYRKERTFARLGLNAEKVFKIKSEGQEGTR